MGLKIARAERVQMAGAAKPAPADLEALTPRPRGRRWMATRARIQLRQGSICQSCGCVWFPWRDHVDHEVPREEAVHTMGEAADADQNLQLLCDDCHKAKSDRETRERAERGKQWK